MLPSFHSFCDELTKIAVGGPAPNPATPDSDGYSRMGEDDLGRLLSLQKKLAPLEGSNMPGRLRYLRLKAEGRLQDGAGAAVQQPAAPTASSFAKQSSMALDQRRLGLGGVPRPPFPTVDSLRPAANQLKKAQDTLKFNDRTTTKMMRPPGPSIGKVAPTIGMFGKIRTPAIE